MKKLFPKFAACTAALVSLPNILVGHVFAADRQLSPADASQPCNSAMVAETTSPTEGVITHDFIPETQMQADLLQMLADFSSYMKNGFEECGIPNAIGEGCGCFRGENTMGSNEQGVRPNADMSMICAFLVKYGKDKVRLPDNVTWNDIASMASKSLVYAYSTHKANRLKACNDNNYWGSVSLADHVWESSLWAMSVAYSAFFQWDSLSERQKGHIEALLKAECNYELERSVPTGYEGDTKAEENGWEADILAATLGLFPNDILAPRWFERLREFAVNSYSHLSDATDNTIIDPEYDSTTVATLFKGQNLYDDYTLQNHDLFHTSYQNVVIQELGEAALALKMFQTGLHGLEKWRTNALMHNCRNVAENVLNWLALSDGELAMPNGNDWSLFLFDQITSYSTMACFLADGDALMLENLAYKYIKARQQTTGDGSWLLNPDVGARRMGVQAHRVMMTWLMHHHMPTSSLTPASWADFNEKYSAAKIFPDQNIIRASTPDRFTCFSWSSGLKSYTGYFTPNTPDNNKIIVPFRANNTGNLLGWHTVEGRKTDAVPIVSGIYELDGKAYTMNGELSTNEAALNNRFALYSTPGNAFIYTDCVKADSAGIVTGEYGGLLAISTDPLTKEKRTLHSGDGSQILSDGQSFETIDSEWLNIDNSIGIVTPGNRKMGFGNRSLNNSIHTAKLYSLFSTDSIRFCGGDIIGTRNVIFYSNVDAATTRMLSGKAISLADKAETGWNGVIAPDPDGTYNLLLANFRGDTQCTIAGIRCFEGAPVFAELTTVSNGTSSATFSAGQNRSVTNEIKVFVDGQQLTAIQDGDNPAVAYVSNPSVNPVEVFVTFAGPEKTSGSISIPAGGCVKVSAAAGMPTAEPAAMPSSAKN